MARVVGLYPGTFDPPTNGHFDIIMRGARVVEELVVGVAINAGKGPLFGIDDRVTMVEEWIDGLEDRDLAKRITVQTWKGCWFITRKMSALMLSSVVSAQSRISITNSR